MEAPRRLLEDAVELMRQRRGNEALNLVRDYEITTFAQLEAACHRYGLETWRPKDDVEVHKNAPDYWE
jgi:hypothetical protein